MRSGLEYWNGLAFGANFLGKKLEACLEVLHVDIIKVWNFNDPDEVHKLTYIFPATR